MTTLVLPLILADAIAAEDPATRFIRLLTVFLLAMWVGFEVITKVPQRLHTPLTSGSNAISGITAVGAIVVAGALEQVGKRNDVKILIAVDGGGLTGQAGACRLGIARALKVFDVELAEPLRQGGLLTRDGRMKERKKYGLRGARRGTQFSKR